MLSHGGGRMEFAGSHFGRIQISSADVYHMGHFGSRRVASLKTQQSEMNWNGTFEGIAAAKGFLLVGMNGYKNVESAARKAAGPGFGAEYEAPTGRRRCMNITPPAADETDAELLAQVAGGDTAAFGRLYDRFSQVLYSLAMKILRNSSAAEDLLQEVFLQIWEKADTYDRQLSKPITWAVTMTRHRAIDRIRAGQRGQRLVEAAINEQAVAEQSLATDTVLAKETAGIVREALARLAAEQRQAIEMAFFTGLSQSEIAETLELPLGTVKARIRRGMLQLRDVLHAQLGEDWV